MLMLILAAALSDGGSTLDAGVRDGGYDPTVPSTWRLHARLPPGDPEREALVVALTATPSPRAIGEAALTRVEAEALLDDPRAQLVYADKAVSIVAPSMGQRHRQQHLDLMKAFLVPERVEAGAQFALQHADLLARAEKKHGVDREAIIAILTWESKLGTVTGDWLVFNVFTSQAFFIDQASAVALSSPAEKALADDEKQKKRVETIRDRARSNLLALVRQCKARGIDPLAVKGSWAGALGFPQFMPASLRFADDGNGDGVIDLFTFDDAVFSIGRYLAEAGWAKNPTRAVWNYNHENAYVEGVLAYAGALKLRLEPDAGQAAPPQKKPSSK
jgi:membrane-bound lytic murein transglycosylase B